MLYPSTKNSFFGEFDSLLNAISTTPVRYTKRASGFAPKANVYENDNGYQISLAAPGLARADFDIDVTDGILTVSSEAEINSESAVRREFKFSKFSRSWSLPETAQVDSITAEYQAGILNLNIPVEQVTINKTKKIEVN